MYPGNHTDSEILSVPRNLKTRPGAPETHLAYITDDEGELLKKHKPGTPHKGPHDIPNYDSWDWEGGTIAQGGGFSSDSGSSEQLDYGGGPDLGGAGSTTDWSGSISNEDAFTPHDEIYGPGSATPGETGYGHTTMTSDNWSTYEPVWKAIQSMDPNTLAFFGYKKGSYNIPNELMAQVAEGSIVGGYEGEISSEPYTGTWDQIESPGVYGEHPMFPGGVSDYYDIMNNPYLISTTGGGGDSGGGPHYGGGYYGSGSGGGGSGGGGGGGSLMQFPGAEGGNPHIDRWGQPTIQGDYIRRMRNPHIGGYNRGGIVSLC